MRVGDSLSSVRIANSSRRVQEDDVGRLCPRVRVPSRVLSFVCDGTRTEFEKETGHRRAPGSSVDPENERILLWVLRARLEEPIEETGLVISTRKRVARLFDIEVTRVRFRSGVAKGFDLVHSKFVRREFGMLDELV